MRAQRKNVKAGPVFAAPLMMTNRLYLLRELVKRDLAARFAGSTLGRAWAIA